ncbi:MAG: S8 family serine peptidase, partial [Candidatus Zixiibacteriota bacterium]
VSFQKLSLSGDRVTFGIATLDKSLDNIKAINAQPIFPWRRGSDAKVGTDDMSKYFEIQISDDIKLSDAILELQNNPYVRSVTPVYAMPMDIDPNDPNFNLQWGIKKINDTAAFNLETGSANAVVAIVDGGVLYSHPDLADHIWINDGEDIDGDRVIMDPDDIDYGDNDLNAISDDFIGYDFFNGFGSGLDCWGDGEDCSGWDNDPIDFGGHGTHCAGIAAAVSNNSVGVAGVAGGWGGGTGPYSGPRIMCLRAGASAVDPDYGYETGYMTMSACASAVDYAAFNGADVVNCSWGMSQVSALTTAFLRCRDSGVVVIASAGNEGVTIGDYYDYWYPDGEKLIISVAWTNSSDRRDASSNYGYWIDISAPGSSIYSTYSNHYSPTYASLGGTSMSTPHIVGAVALLRSHNPNFTEGEIKDLLYNNCDPMPDEIAWIQGNMGFGRLNTYNMFDSLSTAKFSAGPVLVGEAPLTIDFTDESPYSPTSWTWDFGDGGNASTQNAQHTYNDFGIYNPSLTVTDQFGTHTDEMLEMVMITADTIKVASKTVRPDSSFVVPVYLSNRYSVSDIIFPFIIQRANGSAPSFLAFDSLVPDSGSRIAYFERVKKQTSDNLNKKYTYLLNSDYYGDGSNYLQPGAGHIFNMYFHQTATVTGNEILTIKDTTISSWNLELGSVVYNYKPTFIDGTITIAVCTRGDANLNGVINILDIVYLIEWLYKGSLNPPDPVCGDADANGTINILDITYLIAYLYKGGPAPPQ